MSIIGYARVSSVGQSLDVQIEKLSEYGCERIFEEKRSGTTAQRPEFKNCIEYLREGDVLVITKLDRLARSTLHLHSTLDKLLKKGVGFKVLDQSIDTTTKEGRLTFSILACIAEFETELRKERQAEGIKKALDNGVRFGAKPKLNERQLDQLAADKEQGFAISELMAKYNISKASVYRFLALNKNNETK